MYVFVLCKLASSCDCLDSGYSYFVIDVCRYPRDLRWLGLGPGVRIYPAGPGVEWIETLVTLVRQETGFGFRIVGGTEEGSQVRSMVRKELLVLWVVGG
jgi:hypothetical protein